MKPTNLGSNPGDPESFGELSYTNALPWVEVKPATYSPTGDMKLVLPELLKRHLARTKLDKEFQYLNEDVAEIKSLREKNRISLNQTERRSEQKLQEAREALRESRRKTDRQTRKGTGDGATDRPLASRKSPTRDDGLQADERSLATQLAEEKADKSADDVLLSEAARILSDEIELRTSLPRLVAEVKPVSTLTIP